MVNVEYKYSELNLIPTTVDWLAIQGNFHNIAQGTTSQTRNGDLIKLRSLEIKMFMLQFRPLTKTQLGSYLYKV